MAAHDLVSTKPQQATAEWSVLEVKAPTANRSSCVLADSHVTKKIFLLLKIHKLLELINLFNTIFCRS